MPASAGTAFSINEVLARHGLPPLDVGGLQVDIGNWRNDVRRRIGADTSAVAIGDALLPMSTEFWTRFAAHVDASHQQPLMYDLWKAVLARTSMSPKVMPHLDADGYLPWLLHRSASGGSEHRHRRPPCRWQRRLRRMTLMGANRTQRMMARQTVKTAGNPLTTKFRSCWVRHPVSRSLAQTAQQHMLPRRPRVTPPHRCRAGVIDGSRSGRATSRTRC